MRDDLTHSQKARRDIGRRRMLRQMLVLVAVAVAMAVLWSFLGDRVFFLASVDGVVLRKEIKRVMINREGERYKESRYTLVIRDAAGRVHDYGVEHDVFIQVEEGSSVRKAPFSGHFSME